MQTDLFALIACLGATDIVRGIGRSWQMYSWASSQSYGDMVTAKGSSKWNPSDRASKSTWNGRVTYCHMFSCTVRKELHVGNSCREADNLQTSAWDSAKVTTNRSPYVYFIFFHISSPYLGLLMMTIYDCLWSSQKIKQKTSKKHDINISQHLPTLHDTKSWEAAPCDVGAWAHRVSMMCPRCVQVVPALCLLGRSWSTCTQCTQCLVDSTCPCQAKSNVSEAAALDIALNLDLIKINSSK